MTASKESVLAYRFRKNEARYNVNFACPTSIYCGRVPTAGSPQRRKDGSNAGGIVSTGEEYWTTGHASHTKIRFNRTFVDWRTSAEWVRPGTVRAARRQAFAIGRVSWHWSPTSPLFPHTLTSGSQHSHRPEDNTTGDRKIAPRECLFVGAVNVQQ
jgi:hypothetical protein